MQKLQRNGLAVDLEEDLKPTENLSESADPAEGKSDKVHSQGKATAPVRV